MECLDNDVCECGHLSTDHVPVIGVAPGSLPGIVCQVEGCGCNCFWLDPEQDYETD